MTAPWLFLTSRSSRVPGLPLTYPGEGSSLVLWIVLGLLGANETLRVSAKMVCEYVLDFLSVREQALTLQQNVPEQASRSPARLKVTGVFHGKAGFSLSSSAMEASQRHGGAPRPRSTEYLGRPSPGQQFLQQRSPASPWPKRLSLSGTSLALFPHPRTGALKTPN